MSRKGQTTSLAERVEMGERWKAGQTDPEIAQVMQRPLATVQKWRRRYQQQGRDGLGSQIGRPKKGPLARFPSEMVATIAKMRKTHPGWGPLTILTELGKDPDWAGKVLPSRSRIAAYLKQKNTFLKEIVYARRNPSLEKTFLLFENWDAVAWQVFIRLRAPAPVYEQIFPRGAQPPPTA